MLRLLPRDDPDRKAEPFDELRIVRAGESVRGGFRVCADQDFPPERLGRLHFTEQALRSTVSSTQSPSPLLIVFFALTARIAPPSRAAPQRTSRIFADRDEGAHRVVDEDELGVFGDLAQGAAHRILPLGAALDHDDVFPEIPSGNPREGRPPESPRERPARGRRSRGRARVSRAYERGWVCFGFRGAVWGRRRPSASRSPRPRRSPRPMSSRLDVMVPIRGSAWRPRTRRSGICRGWPSGTPS